MCRNRHQSPIRGDKDIVVTDAAGAVCRDPGRLAETLRGLCPGRDDAVWALLRSDQDILLEPTVGGKSGVEARVSCRHVEADRS
jgi:hypothetical protein